MTDKLDFIEEYLDIANNSKVSQQTRAQMLNNLLDHEIMEDDLVRDIINKIWECADPEMVDIYTLQYEVALRCAKYSAIERRRKQAVEDSDNDDDPPSRTLGF